MSRLVGVEDDLDRLSVGAMISVGRIRHIATGIADSGRKNAWPAPYQLLHSPEAPPGKNCAFSVCRSEEHTSELQSLMRLSYAVFCLKKKTNNNKLSRQHTTIN